MSRSKKQKAVLLTGQLLRKCYCTTELIKFLEDYGFWRASAEVKDAFELARGLAHQLGKEAIEEANKDV